MRYRILPGARVDLGWTGIAHAQAWPADQVLAFPVTCPEEDAPCAVAGGAAGDPFGAPIPLAAGGIPACIVNRLRAPLGGSLERATGCAAIELRLTARVHLAESVARPCPVCAGDGAPNDGRREGRCEGGAHAGAACDAQGRSAAFGATSHDCPPRGDGIGDLPIDLTPLGTGTARLAGGPACAATRPGGACPCAGQMHRTACVSGTCPDGERCDGGPVDGVCEGQPFRECRLEAAAADCETRHPGAGRCIARPRPCFAATIAATGTCSPTRPTWVATFCAGATRATALNASTGLPGPGRLVLPVERVSE